jgi:beta-glucanase (GH16 family)
MDRRDRSNTTSTFNFHVAYAFSLREKIMLVFLVHEVTSMKCLRLALTILVVVLLYGSGLGLSQQPAVQMHYMLVWADEFNGPNGSAPDPSKWTYDIGGNGWGNDELETYTNRTPNAHIQDGNLVIQATKEQFTGPDGKARPYTSARLKTLGLFEQAYGRIEARIKVPSGHGMWPAFWMMGNNLATAGWPQCGEIDIMENLGREPSIVHGTVHGPGYSGMHSIGALYTLPDGRRFADDFHVFKVEWEPNALRFYVDDQLYKTTTNADLPADATWVFDHPFFIILNLAVGGNWPGNPDASAVFPQTMLVDYVRVYKLM